LSTVLAGAASCHDRAAVRESGSPPKRLRRSVGMLPGFSVPSRSAKEMSDGTDHQWVIRAELTKPTGDSSWLRCGTTRVPPRLQVTNRS
jgi:hypothetical protein